MLNGSERVGSGHLLGPEDIAYDPITRIIYTGCTDGWVKKVRLPDFTVENWVNTGGRPLGIALGRDNDVIVADAEKGLLKVTSNGDIELLTNEAEGQPFKLTDDVDIADDGVIYFSDASHKYRLAEFTFDFYEGRPNGRLLSYDPSTKKTALLVGNIYFANGVAVSPDQTFVVFCETPMSRCKKYYIKGERKGSVDIFIENLPGVPDNLRYDGEGHYWISLSSETPYLWTFAQKYPVVRKVMAIMEKYAKPPLIEKNGGSIAVDLEGQPIAHYFDSGLNRISSSVKIDDHLYLGSIEHSYIVRLNLSQYPAVATES
jgi:sugar lactone lactonase YvrE